jgi:hypothetical protein
MRRAVVKRAAIWAAAALAAALPPVAGASGFVDLVRSRAAVTLKADSARAIVYYRKDGAARHVLVSGAVNARQPVRAAPQVRFRVDYSGGRSLWKRFGGRCGAYDGPRLPFLVAACRAPNGSYWAVQEWMVDQPNFGVLPWTVRQHMYSIRVSHWTGPVAQVELHSDWIYSGRWHEVFGRASYLGVPIHGFGSTSRGVPTDGYGRLLYLDTFGSRYGRGWRRENAFLPHGPTGVFCAGFYPHRGGPPGNGSRYRVTLVGPGVTPDVQSSVDGLRNFSGSAADAAYEASQNRILDRLAAGGRWCHRH